MDFNVDENLFGDPTWFGAPGFAELFTFIGVVLLITTGVFFFKYTQAEEESGEWKFLVPFLSGLLTIVVAAGFFSVQNKKVVEQENVAYEELRQVINETYPLQLNLEQTRELGCEPWPGETDVVRWEYYGYESESNIQRFCGIETATVDDRIVEIQLVKINDSYQLIHVKESEEIIELERRVA